MAHEFETPNNPPQEKNMDFWNNKVGREIAQELKKEYGSKLKNYSEKQIDDLIAAKIMQRMKEGKLITHPSDKRKYTGFAADIPTGKIFTAEDIGQMSPREFLKNEPAINTQLKGIGVPRELEAKQAVQSGTMIWVNAYKRGDGVEVSGYYREK